jgi:hypothetical protein
MYTKIKLRIEPFAVCCSCGKILYPSQVHWLKNVDENLWRARSFISPSSSLKIEKKVVQSIFPHEQQTAKGFVKEITFQFVTASTNCNFLGYSVKFYEEITCKENS